MRAVADMDPFWFVRSGGETGALVRTVDWSRTALGPPERWPLSLQLSLGILFNSRHPMFLFWGPELVQFYNDAYRPSFGQGKHPAAMGQRGEACWPEIWHLIGPQIRDVMEHARPSWHEDQLVPILRNGRLEDVWWTYSYSPVLGEDGRVAGTLVVCTETTQSVLARRQLEAMTGELQAAVEAREQFLSIASHELRTPLTGLMLQVDLARRTLARDEAAMLQPARVLRLLQQAEHGLQRMRRLVDDMLDVTRIQSGKLELRRERVDLALLLRETLERFEPQLAEVGSTASLQLPDTLVAEVDRHWVEQVLSNLLTNATRYAPGAPITASLSAAADRATVVFEDRGPGIPQEHLARLFHPFERFTHAHREGGLGLGLFIVQEILRAHGGEVAVHSEPGWGTRFTLAFPLAGG